MRARHPIHSSSEGVPPGGLVSVRRSSPTSRNTRVRRATAVSALLVALAIGAQAEETGSRGIVRVRAEYGPDYSKLQRVALVIGNSRYAHGELANAVNDARDMTSALEGLGFTVVAGYDLDKRGINKKIRDFGKRLEQSKGVGLFYYAGHGAQYRGRDYLIPIDADIEAEDEINDGAVDATGVLEKMEVANNRLNIVILDACRDNPFPRAFSRGGGGGWSGNLATNMPSGSLVAYATAPGDRASDGRGRNGLYTKHLLRAIQTPGLELGGIFKTVRRSVLGESARTQRPWENSSLTGDFYFSRGAPTRRDDQSPARAPSKTASGEAALAPQSGPPLPQMVRVPAGTFLMGRDDMDPDERPQHPVEIQGFDIGRYEVTFEEYDAFASDTNRARPHDMNWGRGRRPVINVSWQDAAAYVAWLTRETGENYRLPTEAEWEYVAMAGATTHFAFGDQPAEICTHGNGADRDTDFTWRNKQCSDAYRKQTAPVGHFPPNQFGVNDMIGNVWEWVSSCWTNDYRSRADEACQHRVLRGGAWDSRPRHMRGANRSKNRPGSTNHNFGFRVARQ